MNRQSRPFYMITGPPEVGKSKVTLHLGKLGFHVILETYRWIRLFLVVESELDRNRGRLFPSHLFYLQLAFEAYREDSALEIPCPVVLDRCCIDFYAYILLHANYLTYHFERFEYLAAKRIRLAFYLQAYGQEISKDWLRREDMSRISQIATYLQYAYRQVGVSLVELENREPKHTAEEIVEIIRQRDW